MELEAEKNKISLPLTEDWNQAEKVILERRSVRWYKPEQAPEHLVRRILEAGRYAPSAGNSQPWKFIVIRDKAMLEEMEHDVRQTCKISLKMELHWRSNPVGKVRKNLPFFKELAYEYFTQKD